MEPIQTLDVTEDPVWREDEIMTNEFGDLEEAYKIEGDIKILKKRLAALEERRANIIEDAIGAGNLTQIDRCGNHYELKATDRTVRTLNEDQLSWKFPEVYKLIAKPAKVSIKDALERLGQAQIDECSTTKTSTSWKLGYVLGKPKGVQ